MLARAAGKHSGGYLPLPASSRLAGRLLGYPAAVPLPRGEVEAAAALPRGLQEGPGPAGCECGLHGAAEQVAPRCLCDRSCAIGRAALAADGQRLEAWRKRVAAGPRWGAPWGRPVQVPRAPLGPVGELAPPRPRPVPRQLGWPGAGSELSAGRARAVTGAGGVRLAASLRPWRAGLGSRCCSVASGLCCAALRGGAGRLGKRSRAPPRRGCRRAGPGATSPGSTGGTWPAGCGGKAASSRRKRAAGSRRVQLKKQISETVQLCKQSLFIFDETEKLHSGLLDAIKPYVDHYDSINEVDYRRSIFLFLSNIGGNIINQVTLDFWRAGRAREEITMEYLEQHLCMELLESTES
nr:torsin-3A isoform X3 [Caretta caretta]